jgi:hypothetical protein
VFVDDSLLRRLRAGWRKQAGPGRGWRARFVSDIRAQAALLTVAFRVD